MKSKRIYNEKLTLKQVNELLEEGKEFEERKPQRAKYWGDTSQRSKKTANANSPILTGISAPKKSILICGTCYSDRD